MGLDSAFFRVHYDLKTEAEQRRLAGTVALFAAAVGTTLFGLVVLFSGPLTAMLFGSDPAPRVFVVLTTLDVYLGVFAFVPLNLLRIQDRPGLFSTFSAVRHTVNTVLKVVLVATGFGVGGVLVSDAAATGLFSLSLVPVLARGATWAFSPALLRETLAFGLPKVPHGFMVQIQNLADRKILDLFVTRAELGIYQMGYTFGTGVKFAVSAFEPAWQPFVYSQIRKPDAPQILARIVTYAWAGFLGLGVPLAMLAPELLHVMTTRPFWPAAPMIPVVVLAYLLHGAFLLTSIGIGIEKKARYYPVITAVAATTNVAANFALAPRFGMLGAAWATVLSYGVMAALGLAFSQRVYPIAFEWGRLLRLSGAAAAVFVASRAAPAALAPAVAMKLLLLLAFPLLVLATGAAKPDERAWLKRATRPLLPR
jgi:O-antigen/teichoic acid export membrane protein